jgi:hypothetical protein
MKSTAFESAKFSVEHSLHCSVWFHLEGSVSLVTEGTKPEIVTVDHSYHDPHTACAYLWKKGLRPATINEFVQFVNTANKNDINGLTCIGSIALNGNGFSRAFIEVKADGRTILWPCNVSCGIKGGKVLAVCK